MHRNRTIAAVLTAIVAAMPFPPAAGATATGPDPAFQAIALAGPVTVRDTRPFSLLGITWADPRAAIDGIVRVRTRPVGATRWTAWRDLEADGGSTGTRGATDPLWVGPSDAVEARVVGARRALPAGLRVDLINPDAVNPEPADRRAPAPLPDPRPRTEAGRAGVALPARPVPRMVTRAGWRANEAMVQAAAEYTGPVQVFFVHHTATGNGYSCSQSASIVRGIQAYQVRSRGWDDIGYNFLVDRCGTIFEGRGGGVGRSVLGAHTLGFNENASAIAVIGTYGAAGVTPTVRTAIATVAAYKLGAYGNPPNGRVLLTSGGSDRYPRGRTVAFNRISGHRDAGRTSCPGDALYAQLPAIRAIAGAAPAGLRVLRMGGAARTGSLLFTKGLVRPLWTVGTPSALINRFEVWVDGRLRLATPGTHRTTALRLPPGGHNVAVRALHLSGRSTTVTSKMVSDSNAPVFTGAPDLVLRPGPLDGSVPIRLNWTATDVNGLSGVALVRPTGVNLGTTARSRNGTVRPGVPTTFTVRAADRAGNSVDASVTRTPVVLSEAAAQRTGIWRTLRDQAYLGGVALGATAGGSSMTWTFTGRSAALAVGRGALSGRVRIFVDGRDNGFVDLRSPRTIYRQAVWARWWTESAQHTVRVEVEGTAGRPGAVVDGLVYLK